MIPSLLILAQLAVVTFVARDLIASWLRPWPRPGQPHRLHCDRCQCTAPDGAWMAVHVMAQHPHTFDGPSFGDGTVPGNGRARAA